jgi:hypothetical protein
VCHGSIRQICHQWLELEGEEVGSTLTQTVFNGVNAFAGMTQFVLPSIMADVGWIFVPLTIAICATSLYTISLLEACQVIIDLLFGLFRDLNSCLVVCKGHENRKA